MNVSSRRLYTRRYLPHLHFLQQNHFFKLYETLILILAPSVWSILLVCGRIWAFVMWRLTSDKYKNQTDRPL